MNLAIIGLGNWGKKLLIEFKKEHKIKYCHTAGNIKNLNWLKNTFSEIKIANQINEILNDDSVEAIIIATPIKTHKNLVQKSLLHNKHVFVEKPLSQSFSESKSLVEIAKKKNLCLFVGNIFLYHPVILKLQKLLQNEKIQSIYGVWLKTGTFNSDIITNLLYHEICIIHELIGKPKKIIIEDFQKFISKSDILDVKITFSNQIKCSFHINRISKNKQKSITIITKKNCYLWENDKLFKFSKKNSEYKIFYESKQTPLENECKQFTKSITNNSQKFQNAEKSLEILRILCTIM